MAPPLPSIPAAATPSGSTSFAERPSRPPAEPVASGLDRASAVVPDPPQDGRVAARGVSRPQLFSPLSVCGAASQSAIAKFAELEMSFDSTDSIMVVRA